MLKNPSEPIFLKDQTAQQPPPNISLRTSPTLTSALLCLTLRPHSRPNTAHAIPPHTSQAAEHRTAQQPNTHCPAGSKLGFEPVKCTGWGA